MWGWVVDSHCQVCFETCPGGQGTAEPWFHLDFVAFPHPRLALQQVQPFPASHRALSQGLWESKGSESWECNSQAAWLLPFPASQESALGTGAFQQLCSSAWISP